jgi:hypothetical protein
MCLVCGSGFGCVWSAGQGVSGHDVFDLQVGSGCEQAWMCLVCRSGREQAWMRLFWKSGGVREWMCLVSRSAGERAGMCFICRSGSARVWMCLVCGSGVERAYMICLICMSGGSKHGCGWSAGQGVSKHGCFVLRVRGCGGKDALPAGQRVSGQGCVWSAGQGFVAGIWLVCRSWSERVWMLGLTEDQRWDVFVMRADKHMAILHA